MEENIDEYYYNNEDNSELEPQLSLSKQLGKNFEDLYKLNELYLSQLINLSINKNNPNNNKSKSKKINLPFNDMKVINSLLKDNYAYLLILLKYKNIDNEFMDIYNISLDIIDSLNQFGEAKIYLYQKIQKLKFGDLKFQSLRICGKDADYKEADALLDEAEKIQKDVNLKNYITKYDIASLNLNRALVKFYLADFDAAKEYALRSLKILEYISIKSDQRDKSVINDDNKDKYILKLAQTYEFLAELYDLLKDYKNVLACYEKCYYLYLGRYGINHPLLIPYKKKKEFYEKKIGSGEPEPEEGEGEEFEYGKNFEIHVHIWRP